MSASIVAIGDLLAKNRGWTEQQRADLFRVADMLNRAGMRVATECGMSDEGDPWFVFANDDTGEVIAHFARIDGFYVAASVPTGDTIRARSFKDVIEGLIRHQPLARESARARWSEVHANPIAALAAFVAAALIVAREKPAEAGDAVDAQDTATDGHDETTPASRAETVHGQVVAAVRATPPAAETAAGGWEWLSIARAGLTVAMIAVTDAFAFAFDRGDDAAAADDLIRPAATQETDGARAERDQAAHAGMPAEHGHQPAVDHAQDAHGAAMDGDDLRHDATAIVLNQDPTNFVFHPAPPTDEAVQPAGPSAVAAADTLDSELAVTQRGAEAAGARQMAPHHADAENLSLHEDAAAKPAAKAESAAPEAVAPAAADAPALHSVKAQTEAAATPAFEVAKASSEAIAGAKTFVIGNADLADHFSLVTSLKTIKLFDTADTPSSSAVTKVEASVGGTSIASAAESSRLSLQADDSFLPVGSMPSPASASVSLSNGSGELSSFDGGRYQTIRLGAEADVVMVTPGLSHIRIENFTAGVDRFYISQWLLDHSPPDVSITGGGDVVMSFHGNFSVTLVGLVAPQPEFHPVA